MKAAKIIIPILILILAVVLIVKRTGPPPRPDEVDQRVMSVIDAESLETIEMTIGDYANAETDATTGYKINSDGRKVAEPRSCMACGELVPPAPIPVGTDVQEEERIEANYVCPRCGGQVYQ